MCYTNVVITVQYVVGEIPVKVQHGEQTETQTLIVVSGSEPRRVCLQKLPLQWQNMYHQISSLSSEISVLPMYKIY